MGLRELAGKTGLSPAFLSGLETGNRPALPGEMSIRRLAKVLGASADELLCAAGKVPTDVVNWLTADPDRLRHVRARMERDAAAGR